MDTNEKSENNVFNFMNPEALHVRNLPEILGEFTCEQLTNLLQYCQGDYATQRLFKCTQMRDEAVRSSDGTSTRGKHDMEVSENAEKIASSYFLAQNGGEKLDETQQKQVIIAKIIGLVHDWGHTPMGHDAEEVFSKQADIKFGHDIYSGVVFANLITELKKSPDENFRKIAEKIESSGLKDYIIQGVQTHSALYYTEELENNLATDVPLMASRLADTYSFMLTDLVDLSKVDRAAGAKGKILTHEILTDYVEKGTLTQIASSKDGILPTEQDKATPFIESLPEGFDYKSVIDTIVNGSDEKVSDLRAKMLLEVTTYNLQRGDGKLVTIPDEIKFLREITANLQKPVDKRWKLPERITSFIDTMSKEDIDKAIRELGLENSITTKEQLAEALKANPDNFFDFFNSKLVEANKEFNKTCPTVNLIYQMQDELVYNQLLGKKPEAVLGNDKQKNTELLVTTFNGFKNEFSNLPKEEQENFINNVYPNFQKYMAFKGDAAKLTVENAYAIYKTQLLTNADIEQGRVAPDKSIEDDQKHQFEMKTWDKAESEPQMASGNNAEQVQYIGLENWGGVVCEPQITLDNIKEEVQMFGQVQEQDMAKEQQQKEGVER